MAETQVDGAEIEAWLFDANREALGRWIRAVRHSKRMTQTDVMSPMGTAAYLSRIEAGERRPGPAMLRHIANRLEVTPQFLLWNSGRHDLDAVPREISDGALAAHAVAIAAETWLAAPATPGAFEAFTTAVERWQALRAQESRFTSTSH